MAVFITRGPDPFSSGTGTSETSTVSVQIPSNARSLVAVRGHASSVQGNPAEAIAGVFKITDGGGGAFNSSPFEWFAELGNPKLGSVDQVGSPLEPRYWKANLPVIGSGTMNLSYEPLDVLANNGTVSADFVWSTEPTQGINSRKRICSRETATSSTTGESLQIQDMAVLTDITFLVTASTVGADDSGAYSLAVTSSSLNDQQTVSMNGMVHVIEGTSGVAQSVLQQRQISINASSPVARFTSTLSEHVALGTAGMWAYSIGYIPTQT